MSFPLAKQEVQIHLTRYMFKVCLEFCAVLGDETPLSIYRSLRIPLLLICGEATSRPVASIARKLAEVMKTRASELCQARGTWAQLAIRKLSRKLSPVMCSMRYALREWHWPKYQATFEIRKTEIAHAELIRQTHLGLRRNRPRLSGKLMVPKDGDQPLWQSGTCRRGYETNLLLGSNSKLWQRLLRIVVAVRTYWCSEPARIKPFGSINFT